MKMMKGMKDKQMFMLLEYEAFVDGDVTRQASPRSGQPCCLGEMEAGIIQAGSVNCLSG